MSVSRSQLISKTLLIVSIIFAGFLVLNKEYVHDLAIVNITHKPTQEMRTIAEKVRFTQHGELIFMASRTQVDNARAFNKTCGDHEKSSAVLGCYVNRRIYLYNIDNKELDGIVEVTAAHEMLHAAYERLYPWERKEVDALLLQEFETLRKDNEFTERMSVYAALDPASRINELHSIIGTERKEISDKLEAYYKKYFIDRHRISELYAQYSSLFFKLEAQAKDLADRVNKAADDLNQQINTYNNNVASLSAQISDFNRRAEAGDFSSYRDFYNERSVLVANSAQLDRDLAAINQAIKEHDALKKELNDTSLHLNELNNSIDSTVDARPELEA